MFEKGSNKFCCYFSLIYHLLILFLSQYSRLENVLISVGCCRLDDNMTETPLLVPANLSGVPRLKKTGQAGFLLHPETGLPPSKQNTLSNTLVCCSLIAS